MLLMYRFKIRTFFFLSFFRQTDRQTDRQTHTHTHTHRHTQTHAMLLLERFRIRTRLVPPSLARQNVTRG